MARRDNPTNDYWQELLAVGPFGGLDMTTSPFYVGMQNFVDGENFAPNLGYGGYYTVLGRTVFLASPVPGTVTGVTKMERPGQIDTYIFATTISNVGYLYYAVAGGTPAPLTTPEPLSPDKQTWFASSGMWVFLTNATDTPLKIDTSLNVTYWGIVAPTTAPVLASDGPAAMLGTYYYSITFGNPNQESSQGAISEPITVIGTGITLTGIPISTDPQVTERNIYREGGSLGQWRLIATLYDNTTTTYTDTTADTSVVGQQLTARRDPPPVFTAIAQHQERIFGFGQPGAPSTAYFSNFEEPYGFNLDTGYIPCGENSFGDYAVQLVSIGSVLCCHKAKSFYAIYGSTDADFQSIFMFNIGTISAQSVVGAYGLDFWLSNQGIYRFDGNSPQNMSDGQFQVSNIKSVLDNMDSNDKSQAVGFMYDKMYHLSFPTILKTYFWDSRSSQWFRLGFAATQAYFDLEDTQFPVVNLNPQAAGEFDAWFQTGTDLGNQIVSYLTTRVSDSPTGTAIKDYRYAIIEAPSQPGQTANILVTVNPGDEPLHYTAAISLFSDPNQFTHSNTYQVDLPDTLQGTEMQFTLKVFSTEQVVIERVAVLGDVVAVVSNQS